jgi:hypothetical protein
MRLEMGWGGVGCNIMSECWEAVYNRRVVAGGTVHGAVWG